MIGLENLLYILSGSCFLTAFILSLWEMFSLRDHRVWIAVMLVCGTLSVTVLIAARWIQLGQGPFLTLYEILLSSLFGLGLVVSIAYVKYAHTRIAAPFALALILLLYVWMISTNPGHTPLPPTYSTPWLWVHVIAGKLFLGCCLIASSLAAVFLLPKRLSEQYLFSRDISRAYLSRDMSRTYLYNITWRWLTVAFVFHSAMLIAGAVWAQDAWGRYWDWDPLETWAFSTWLLMAFGLHARVAMSISQRTGSVLIVSAFALAFLTFFGVPFVSVSPHQGAI